MKPHQDRVVKERKELYEKIQKLSVFIGGQTYQSLGATEKGLLMKQLALMNGYEEVLRQRIDAFSVDEDQQL